MMQPFEESLPTATLSRAETARLEVGRTKISPVTARWLLIAFLGTLPAAPLAELASVARTPTPEGAGTAWLLLAELPREVSASLAGRQPAGTTGAWARIVAANRAALVTLKDFEHALEDESALGRLLRPPAQLVMSVWLGAGSQRVYRGRDGWLFYRPDVEYVTGGGFLEPARLAGRVASADEWTAPPEPDPRNAIVQLKRDLDARGMTLIVMPTPVKPTVHPEKLAGRYEGRTAPLQNPSYAAFLDDLGREGVLVLDVSGSFTSVKRGASHYLGTDTHWRPETMEMAAELLGGFIEAHVPLPAVPDPGYRVDRVEVRHTGDTARMLDLPSDQTVYPAETVWVRRVLQADGTPWRPSRGADVLVLGDSFSNVYSLGSMGWGDAAGFVEQVSYVLRRPVDRMVQNDEGAFATRAMLRQAAGDGTGRLSGKRVVIYQFAARELAFGDWRVIDLKAPRGAVTRLPD